MRRSYSLFAVLFIGIYLIVGRGQWFSELEQQAELGSHALFSPPLNIAQVGEFTWKIPREEWEYKQGDAKLSLVLDRVPGLPAHLTDRSQLQLRLKVAAYAVPKGGSRTDRLLRNWYYTTDEPFTPEARLWSSFGSQEIEYGLGGIRVYPREDIFAAVTVTASDPRLNKGKPRLKLVADHDYAVFGHMPRLRAIRDGGLMVSIVLLAGLGILAWRQRDAGNEP